MLYLDNAATTPVRPEVLEAMMPYLTRWFGNPSSHHTVGEAAADALDRRAGAGRARPRACGRATSIFTSGGTEANNLAVKGIAHRGALAARAARRHVVTTPIEHESILESADYLARVHGFDGHARARRRSSAASIRTAVAGALRDDTALVTLRLREQRGRHGAGCRGDRRRSRDERGVPVHIDAVQAAGWLPLSAADLGVDAISLAGHKLGAPKGTGVLAVRGRVPLEPLLHGGGQERGRRSGTEDVAGAVGFATALELAEAERAESSARVTALRDRFIARVLAAVPTARLTGDPVHRLPGTASFTFAGTSGEAVLLELERRGVVSSSGSACAAGSDEPSHVLLAMGIPAGGRADRRAVHVPARARPSRWMPSPTRSRHPSPPYNRAGEPPPRPPVTVIVPGFDVAPYAADALDSLRRQTPAGLDRRSSIDDASTDGTGRRSSSDAAAADSAVPRGASRAARRARRRPQHGSRPRRHALRRRSSTPTTC